ncbi:hypothetical protein BEN49_20765, partial [Hymenobacter coccineus]
MSNSSRRATRLLGALFLAVGALGARAQATVPNAASVAPAAVVAPVEAPRPAAPPAPAEVP